MGNILLFCVFLVGPRIEKLSLADIFGVVIVNSKGHPDPNGSQFAVHALRSNPGTSGNVMELICQPLDPHPAATSQTWTEHLSQQIQSGSIFGKMEQRLFLIFFSPPIIRFRSSSQTALRHYQPG